MQKLKSVACVAIVALLADATPTIAQRSNRGREPQQQSQPANNNNAQKPRWGATVQSAPKRTTTIKSSQDNYRYREGVYYRKDNTGNFRVGPAPVGVHIRTLPVGYTRLLLNGIAYFYYYGTFYRDIDQVGYEVVTPPVGAIVYNLPDGYEKVIIEGISYYTFDGIYYKTIVDDRGEVAYQVVGDIRG